MMFIITITIRSIIIEYYYFYLYYLIISLCPIMCYFVYLCKNDSNFIITVLITGVIKLNSAQYYFFLNFFSLKSLLELLFQMIKRILIYEIQSD